MNKRTRELIRRERAAQADLTRYYGDAIGQVQRELAVVLHDIETAKAAGQTVNPRWLRQQDSYERWLTLTRQELARYVLAATNTITDLQRGHVGQAIDDSHGLLAPTLAKVAVEFRVPPASVVANMVGRATDGSPLADLLTSAATDAAQAAKQTLIVGVIRGHGPRKIARDLAANTNVGLHRSLLIARTESINAYRETSLESYRANQVVVGTWVWTASLDNRTCSVCWAMDGTEHQLDESMSSHPGCRCTPTPRTKSWQDLGIDLPDTRPPVSTGVDKFARLSSADQRQILGAGKFDAYANGRLALTDLVQPTQHDRWGPGLRERSLQSALTHH